MKKKFFVCALFVLLASVASAEILAGPGVAVVEVDGGRLQGYIRDGIFTYHGVQYAQASPFMPPEKVPAWDGVKLALNYGTMSPQSVSPKDDIFPPHYFWPHWEPRNLTQSHNCQNLNIWTPALDDGKRPVMVWLHGGGHMMGAATVEDVYDGENLSRTGDVVVVSVNHRLNVAGFLNLSKYGGKFANSFNQSTRDLVAALEWIHENISKFGGDPENVTLFGQSGGGAKILTLMATPSAKNLFHKAIVQSGATEDSGMTLTQKEISEYVTELTLKNLGVTPDELLTLPYEVIADASNKALAQVAEEKNIINALGGRSLMWCPVVDGEFITGNPADEKFIDSAKDIPLLIGTALNEWVSMPLLADMAQTQSDNKNFWDDARVGKELLKKYGEKSEAIADAFMKAYPYKKKADALYVDFWLRTRAKKAAALKSDQKGAPVFVYVFTWETPIMGGYAMAYHCSELPFVFNNIKLSEMATGGGEKAQALAEKMSSAWVKFARDGNPGWEAFTRENGATMLFDDDCIITYHHDDELMNLLAPDYKY